MISNADNLDYADLELDVAIVVFTSDGYSDFWDIFFHFFFKNSGLSRYPVYLLSGKKKINDPRVITINSFDLEDETWSTRAIAGLEQINHKFIIAFTEDLLCTDPIELFNLLHLISFVKNNDVSYIRLVPFPPPTPRTKELCSPLLPNVLHRVSLQASLWKRSSLFTLLVKGESPQNFEIYGSRRSRNDPAYFCVNNPLLKYQEVIGGGKVTRHGLRLIYSAGLGPQLVRPIFGIRDQLRRDIRHMKSKIFYALPCVIQELLIRKGFIGRGFYD